MGKKIYIFIIILIVIVGVSSLYFLGQRAEKEEEETSQASLEEQEEESLPEEEELPESLPEEIKIPEEIKAQIEEQGGVVSITADGFEPKEITLTQGEKISWINYDSEVHQIVSESIFNIEEIKPGDIWTFPCDEKGVFEYQVVGYPEKGRIIVE